MRNRGVFSGISVIMLLLSGSLQAQDPDSTLAQEGVFDRPFITSLGGDGEAGATSIGGYVEGNTNYFRQDGLSEGFSMELRRFNIFLYSSISERVRFLSELEFEHGTEEIALETALVDFRVSSALVLRAGILLPPIGYFNQNHDSPKWEFIDRPLVSTGVIPATLSEVGFGVYGKFFSGDLVFSYDAYATNGLGEGVLDNDRGRTDLPSGRSEEQFAEDNNGSPALSGRLAVQRPGFGEVGVSYYGATYNTFEIEGDEVDEGRRVDLFALDLGARLGRIAVRGEAAWARIEIPSNLQELYGDRQRGAHLDIVVPILEADWLGYEQAVLNASFRVEYVDYNAGDFASTGESIGDDVTALVPGVSFRPTEATVFRANYRRHWIRDFPGNPRSNLGGFQFGFATYF